MKIILFLLINLCITLPLIISLANVIRGFTKETRQALIEGDRIRLTWLPNPINHPTAKSCYIGSEGVVRDLDDRGFMLDMGGSSLIVHNKYKFVHLDKK